MSESGRKVESPKFSLNERRTLRRPLRTVCDELAVPGDVYVVFSFKTVPDKDGGLTWSYLLVEEKGVRSIRINQRALRKQTRRTT